jgi:Ca-activated chloride channel family protein
MALPSAACIRTSAAAFNDRRHVAMKRVIAVLVALSMLAGCAQPLEEKSAGKDSDTQTHANRAPAQVSAVTSVPAPAMTEGEDRARIATAPRPEPAPREHAERLHSKRHAEDGRRMDFAPPQATSAAAALGAVPAVGGMVGVSPHPHAYPADRERYQAIDANPVKRVTEAPVSTFSIDVDTGAYANMRRFLNQGRLPPADAVRVEELVNYFPFDYEQPSGEVPFAVHTELAAAPWNPDNVLLRIGIKGQDMAKQSLPPANLVFLVDVSGSMASPDKLALLKSALERLVRELRAQDRITLVTYAGRTAVVLQPTSGRETSRILAAIHGLHAGGSTAGASGIELAYSMAQQSFIPNGINRILLATDGDFNVGISDFRTLKSLVAERRKSGVSLSTLGFGTGNYNEQLMEQLADAGDGAYSYIDNLMEAHKVLVNEMTSTLATIARDVKIQVEFNPATVKEYRLIGYENRLLNRDDFNNDKVDAGDIGAGHTVTALYELTLAGGAVSIDPLRYAPQTAASAQASGELAHVKLRFKAPQSQASKPIDVTVAAGETRPTTQASREMRFAAAVAGFGQVLRGGQYTGKWTLSDARALAADNVGPDRFGYRGEFLRLIDLAQALTTRAPKGEEIAAGR